MLPQFVLHQGSSCPTLMRLQPAKLFVAAVVLLNEHRRPPALLELLLLVVAAEFTLDKDGGLRHLLIKCILQTSTVQFISLFFFTYSARVLQVHAITQATGYLQGYPC